MTPQAALAAQIERYREMIGGLWRFELDESACDKSCACKRHF